MDSKPDAKCVGRQPTRSTAKTIGRKLLQVRRSGNKTTRRKFVKDANKPNSSQSFTSDPIDLMDFDPDAKCVVMQMARSTERKKMQEQGSITKTTGRKNE